MQVAIRSHIATLSARLPPRRRGGDHSCRGRALFHVRRPGRRGPHRHRTARLHRAGPRGASAKHGGSAIPAAAQGAQLAPCGACGTRRERACPQPRGCRAADERQEAFHEPPVQSAGLPEFVTFFWIRIHHTHLPYSGHVHLSVATIHNEGASCVSCFTLGRRTRRSTAKKDREPSNAAASVGVLAKRSECRFPH